MDRTRYSRTISVVAIIIVFRRAHQQPAIFPAIASSCVFRDGSSVFSDFIPMEYDDVSFVAVSIYPELSCSAEHILNRAHVHLHTKFICAFMLGKMKIKVRVVSCCERRELLFPG